MSTAASVYLLIIFYTLHGWNKYFELITSFQVLKLCMFLFAFTFCLWYLIVLIYRDKVKASLLVFLFTFFSLFFFVFEKAFIFFLPKPVPFEVQLFSFALVIVFLFILIFKLKKVSVKLLSYFFILFLILTIVEVTITITNFITVKPFDRLSFVSKTSGADNKSLPSVYLILLDEYPGKESLMHDFGFDNSPFISQLKSEGFNVVKNARSNYKYTLLSLTSMFEGEYIQFPTGQPTYHEDGYRQTLLTMYNNRTFNTFKELGYTTVNLSPFNIHNTEAAYRTRFIPKDDMLILHPSLWDDLFNSYKIYLSKKINDKRRIAKLYQSEIDRNFALMDSVIKLSKMNVTTPMFVYLHLNMPHPPFIYNKNSQLNLNYLTKAKQTYNDHLTAYLEYVQFVNSYVIESIREIKRNSNNKSVIMLMSDHGSKTFALKDSNNVFNSLNAVFAPAFDPKEWYDGFSNVNQFRLFFSQISGVHIPMHSDSSIYK